ncbi:hypothetical protein QTH91_17330 [Variovorax dokdonensis]|uniref:Uncharacterized protein n=1 Tax=Variovorax dokdonensis TaxID=344883 RepID=A0ABT7NE81_9BURK|nr:hypothetical protein [Variovorax dokdonensis]MDM0046258.1 hypothetical protein [Variovorax dokdonensis]
MQVPSFVMNPSAVIKKVLSTTAQAWLLVPRAEPKAQSAAAAA